MNILTRWYKALFGPFPKFKLGEVVSVKGAYMFNEPVTQAEVVSIDDSNEDITYGLKCEKNNQIQYFRQVSESDLDSERSNRVNKLDKILNE